MTIDEIRDNFELLEEWDDRYRYVIELGRTLEPMPEAEHSAGNKVNGCVSQVWLSRQIDRSGNAHVDQFVHGRAHGPITSASSNVITVITTPLSGAPVIAAQPEAKARMRRNSVSVPVASIASCDDATWIAPTPFVSARNTP